MNVRLRRLLGALGPVRWFAVVFLVLLTIVATVGPAMLPDPLVQDVANARAPIGTPGYPLGTDAFGRDVLSRLVYGARIELVIALGATALAMVIGTTLGVIGAYFGRVAETVTMRVITDVLLAFPPVILALLIVTIYGPGPVTLIVSMGILFSTSFARISFGQTLTVTRAEYVEAARAFGAPTPTILLRTVLPNISAPLIVQASLIMAASILLESGLSFLGLGVTPPEPSLGSMVADGQRYMATDVQLILVPSVLVVLTILSFSLIGDALRDWLDPRGRTSKNA